MKALDKKIMLVLFLVVIFAVIWKLKAPQQNISLAQTNQQAAEELLLTEQPLLFHSKDIDSKKVFHLLQAEHPYLSTLSTASYPNGNLELNYEIIRQEEQDKGLDTAREWGKQTAQKETSITGKLKAIHDTLIRACVYEERDDDRVQMAAGAAEDKIAVCAGYARAFQAMCDGAGIDCYYMEDDDMTHAWNVVRLYGETYYIDCTYDDPVPDQGDYASCNYFMLTAEQMKQTHQWDEALYDFMLDSHYPENFAYIQRMQDLQLAEKSLRAADTDEPATEQELHRLNQLLDTTLSESTENTAGEVVTLTKGELYKCGYEALSQNVNGKKRIEILIDNYVVPVIPARQMGF